MCGIDERPTALGFIGLGVMGGPMCRNLVRGSEQPVHVFDASEEAMAAAVAEGARPERSTAEVAAADVVFLSLPSIDEVEQVVAQLLAAPSGLRMIVDMSTSGVPGTRRLAVSARERGVRFVDAPVARRRQAAVEGTLLITVGSSGEEFAWLRPLLATMGSDIVHAGPTGAGQVLKILNNMVLLLNTTALAEAAAIAQGSGLDVGTAFSALSVGSADSYVLRTTAQDTIVPDEYPENAFPADYAAKDLRLALELAGELGVDAASAQRTLRLLENAHERGEGELYYPVIARQLHEGRSSR